MQQRRVKTRSCQREGVKLFLDLNVVIGLESPALSCQGRGGAEQDVDLLLDCEYKK